MEGFDARARRQGPDADAGDDPAGYAETDVLLVPGGGGQEALMEDEEALEFLRVRHDTFSPCAREHCFAARPDCYEACAPPRIGIHSTCCSISARFPRRSRHSPKARRRRVGWRPARRVT